MAANSEDHVQSTFDAPLELSGNTWNKYIFEQIELEDNEDKTECGVKCELCSTQCDFFVYDNDEVSPMCYLGIYSENVDNGVDVPTTFITHHKLGTYHTYTKLDTKN